jgi:hypothetical protein
LHGNVEILILLLQRGAFLPGHGVMSLTRLPKTALNKMLGRPDIYVTRETKLAICRHVVQYANQQEGHDRAATVAFMRASLEVAIQQSANSIDGCQILLEAGMDPSPRHWVWDCAIQQRNEAVCRLLVQYGADPFAEQAHVVVDEQYAATPVLAVARVSNNTSIFEFFWKFGTNDLLATMARTTVATIRSGLFAVMHVYL